MIIINNGRRYFATACVEELEARDAFAKLTREDAVLKEKVDSLEQELASAKKKYIINNDMLSQMADIVKAFETDTSQEEPKETQTFVSIPDYNGTI